MKPFYFTLLCAMTVANATAQSLAVATFEDLNAPSDTYWDGSDGSSMFVSGDYLFLNNYVDWGGFGSWDGFAWSSMTSNAYTSLDDQFNACTGCGVDGSQTFAVAYYSAYMGTFPTVITSDASAFEAKGCYVTNAAYAYQTMLHGDSYTEPFGTDDWFLLTAAGYLDGEETGRCSMYLAKDGEILSEWTYFDLSSLGTVDEVRFTLDSSDCGEWGMNTPAYFCMDNFGAERNAVGLAAVRPADEHSRFDLMGRAKRNAQGLNVRSGRLTFIQ